MLSPIGRYLEANRPLAKKGDKILQNLYLESNKIRSAKTIPDFDVSGFKNVKKLRLAEIDSRQQEFNYLEAKSGQWFAGNEAKTVAKEIKQSGLFNIPDYLVSSYQAYTKMKKDIENGLKNFKLLNLSPRLMQMYAKLCEAESNLLLALGSFSRLEKRYQKDKDFVAFMPNLEQYLNDAEKEMEANKLTKEDQEFLSRIHIPAQRVISRNVSRFNKETPISLSPELHQKISEKLAKQDEAIEKLWNTIEQGKKQTFTRSYDKTNPEDFAMYGDDIPF